MIARWLRRLADYLDPPPPMLARVKQLTDEWDGKLGAGFGEAKRHNVYAQLIKEFPKVSKRELAYAIEWVLR